MATIGEKDIAKKLLESGGHFETDQQVKIMYRYISRMSGAIQYAIFYHEAHDGLLGQDTEFCKNVTLLLLDGGLTKEGKKELERLKQNG